MRQHLARRGFTLVEVAVAAMIGSILLMMMAGVWRSFGRNVSVCVDEAAVATDARLALEMLRKDFNGYLHESPLGTLQEGRLVGQLVRGGELRLCYDLPPANGAPDWMSPDAVVVYSLQGGQLLRTAGGRSFPVAEDVSRFEPARQTRKTRILIDFDRDGATRSLTFIAHDRDS